MLDELAIQPRARAPLGQDSPVIEAVHRASNEPARTVGVNWTLIESSQSIYGLEGIGGADPLEVAAYKQLVDAASMWRSMWLTVVWNKDAVRLSPFLDLLNVGFLVGRSDTALPPGVIEIPLSRPDRLKVGRRPSAWPRAFFVDGVMTYETVPDLLNQVTAVGRPFAAVQAGDDGGDRCHTRDGHTIWRRHPGNAVQTHHQHHEFCDPRTRSRGCRAHRNISARRLSRDVKWQLQCPTSG